MLRVQNKQRLLVKYLGMVTTFIDELFFIVETFKCLDLTMFQHEIEVDRIDLCPHIYYNSIKLVKVHK